MQEELSKKYSFWNLLKDPTIEKIRIPIIQRDYAQGREGKEYLRKRFLEALIDETLDKEDKTQLLDFVYGKQKNNEVNPLDGQQRLTTLWLLHWYIAYVTEELGNEENKRLLLKFSYETRRSSRDFCKMLCEQLPNLPKGVKIVDHIKNQKWFLSAWNQDPTVRAMLNMIGGTDKRDNNKQDIPDGIEEFLANKDVDVLKDYWRKLTDSNGCPIYFYYMSLEKLAQSDELYIKMNARGKALSHFENFKADLIDWMANPENPNTSKFISVVNGGKYTGHLYYQMISSKIDGVWSAYFWNTTKSDSWKGDKMIDNLFLRFFCRYELDQYIIKHNLRDYKSDSKYELLTSLANESEPYSSFDVFAELLDYQEICDFERILDKLSRNKDIINIAIAPCWDKKQNVVFDKYGQRTDVAFLAACLFLQRDVEFDEAKFTTWMRIVWNIITNTDINNSDTMISAMNLIFQLSEHCDEIVKYIAHHDKDFESSKEAMNEERRKCIFIESDLNWETAFIQAESHAFFKGSIGFLLRDYENDSDTIEKFERRLYLAQYLFNDKGINHSVDNDYLILRGIISQYHDFGLIINRSFMDESDPNNTFKVMLRTDTIAQTCISTWLDKFASPTDADRGWSELKKHISDLIKSTSSTFDDWYSKPHELLYKTPDLIKWMQEESRGKKKFHINGYGYYVKVGRANSNNDWMFITGYRNELITALQDNNILLKDWLPSIKVGEQILYQSSWSIYYQYSEHTCITLSPEHITVSRQNENGVPIEEKFWSITDFFYQDHKENDLIKEIKETLGQFGSAKPG